MTEISLRTITPADLSQVAAVQQAYAQVFADAPIQPGELYLSPAFHGGDDVFCVFSDQHLLAYAPLYAQMITDGPLLLPHTLWVEIKARPDLANVEQIKDQLLDCLTQRARQFIDSMNPTRPGRMCFEYRPTETAAIEYVRSRGFCPTESVFFMCRDLAEPIPAGPTPPGINIRRWKMESLPEQEAFIAAYNECFPEAPVRLESWQYFMSAPGWAAGTTIAAFDGQKLVGTVTVYFDEVENPSSAGKAGNTEYIFVRPEWRGKGIARAMIAEGMRFLKENGYAEARLAVRATNDNALGLYRKLGYQVIQRTDFYSKDL